MPKFESSAAEDLSSSEERPSGTHRRAKPPIPKASKKPVDITRFATLEDDELEDVSSLASEVEGPALEVLNDDDIIPEELKPAEHEQGFSSLEDASQFKRPRAIIEEARRQQRLVQKENASRRQQESDRIVGEEKEKTNQHLAQVRSNIARPTRISKDKLPEIRKAIEIDIKRAADAAIAEDEAQEGKFLPKVDAYKMIAERYRKITQDLPDYLAAPQTPEIKEKIFLLHREADELAEWKKEVDHAKGIGPRALVGNRFHEKPFELVTQKEKPEEPSENAA